MKLAVFSDLHLHNFKSFSIPYEDGLTSRAVWVLNVLLMLQAEARRQRWSGVLFCGDFWETQGYLLVPLYRVAYELVAQLASTVPVVAIGGNHDAVTKGEEVASAVDLFGTIENFHIANNQPVYLSERSNSTGPGVTVFGAHAQWPLQDFPEDKCSGKRILLLHETLKGVPVSPDGWLTETGRELDDLLKYMNRNLVSATFIGDIHYRQQLVTKPPVWYVGNAIQKTFGEDQDKGYLVYDAETDEVEFCALDTPQFLTVEALPEAMRVELDADVEDMLNYYRVVPKTLADYDDHRRYAKRLNVRLIPPPELPETRARIPVESSAMSAVKLYVNQTVESKSDRQRLTTLGQQFVKDTANDPAKAN